MRRSGLSRRVVLLTIMLVFCAVLIVLSSLGVLRPVENWLAVPLNALTVLFSDTVDTVNNSDDVITIELLQERNTQLERQLAELQGELIELREKAVDYERLAELLEYTDSTEGREYVTADVIGEGQYGIIRSIIINKGTRDGIDIGMPVVTDLGLVGRIWRVTASSSQVQLITDRNSFVSGRLNTSRAEGTIQGRGLEIGSMRLQFLPLDVVINPGELVYTSGLGGNFPPNIPIGQIISVTNIESELSQEAQISSLINFTTLEQVLVVTNFEPSDLSVFDTGEQ